MGMLDSFIINKYQAEAKKSKKKKRSDRGIGKSYQGKYQRWRGG